MSAPDSRPAASRAYTLPVFYEVTFTRTLLSTLAKDLCLEWRSKDAINAMLFFALLVAVIFSFSFQPTAEEARQVVGGLVWVALLFASTVALNQSWARELRNQVLDAYRISSASANTLFIGKALGNFIFVSALELVIAPLFVLFFNLRPLGSSAVLLLVFVAGTWALVINGTFFAAMSLRTRSRELMLPLLLFPISIPALLAMVSGTTAVLSGEGSTRLPIDFLIVYDVVFTTVCLLLFETVLNAE
jgi:heme exporter protein B